MFLTFSLPSVQLVGRWLKIVWRMVGIEGCFVFIREIVVFYKGKCSLNCVENGREM